MNYISISCVTDIKNIKSAISNFNLYTEKLDVDNYKLSLGFTLNDGLLNETTEPENNRHIFWKDAISIMPEEKKHY